MGRGPPSVMFSSTIVRVPNTLINNGSVPSSSQNVIVFQNVKQQRAKRSASVFQECLVVLKQEDEVQT